MRTLRLIWRLLKGPVGPSVEDRVEEALRIFDRDRAAGVCYDMSREVEDV